MNKATRDWPLNFAGRRVGAVSAFGMSGTNAHVVAAGYEARLSAPAPTAPYRLLVLSAKSEEALNARIAELAEVLATDPDDGSLAATAYTLLAGRHHFRHRYAVVVRNKQQAADLLRAGASTVAENHFSGVVPLEFETSPGLRRSIDLLLRQIAETGVEEPVYFETLCALAELFCQGHDLPYGPVFQGWAPRSQCLPVYPFKRDIYPVGTPHRLEQLLLEQGRDKADAVAREPLGAPIVDAEDAKNRLKADLRQCICSLIRIPETELEDGANLAVLGFDSISLAALAEQITELVGVEVTPDVFFSSPTLKQLCEYFDSQHGDAIEALYRSRSARPEAEQDTRSSASGPAVEPGELKRTPTRSGQPIAILGMSGRFSGARDIDGFSEMLLNGQDGVGEIPASRFDWRDHFGDPATDPRKTNGKWLGAIPGVAEFDSLFFEVPPTEAAGLDPRQRLLMQECWRALEDAGCGFAQLETRKVGVFVGVEEGTTNTSPARAISPPTMSGSWPPGWPTS